MVNRNLFSLRMVFMAMLLFLPTLTFATINVSVDRQSIMVDESFQIIFDSNESAGEPDFSPLQKDFDILSTRQSSNTTIINSQVETNKSWVLDVMAKGHGKLVIPSVNFGKKKSQALAIEILKTESKKDKDTNEDIFFEIEIDTDKPYVQEQVVLTVRLFIGIAINNNASLSEPDLKGADAVIQKLGDDKNYETRRGNKRYVVYERRYAIFPQASGNIQIDPIVFQGRVGTDSRSFNNFLNQSGKTIVRRSDPITLEVQMVPTDYQGEHWLPAQNVQLTETWPNLLANQSQELSSEAQPTFHVGEPVTRNIILQAQGLTASQLPELKTELSDEFKQYPDQAVLSDQVTENGITGTRAEKIAIIPEAAGEFTLPEVEVSWWDTKTDQQATARLPKMLINVLPAANAAVRAPAPEVPVDDVEQSSGLGSTESEDISTNNNVATTSVGPWFELSIIFGLAWLLTVLSWMWFYFRKPQVEKKGDADQSYRKVMAQLKHVCAESNPVAAKDAILDWARNIWSDNPATNLGEVSKRCDGKLGMEIEIVNRLLYSKEALQWDGKELWNAIKEYQHQPRPSTNTNDSSLEPLYRL
ncbi:MAG: hypothetical protein ACI9ZT_001074 [Gammaproteobacteria bacterium]|jgi:hypothetical protein